MLSLSLFILLSGVPRTHARAENSVYIPNLRQLSGVGKFMRRAGPHAVLLRTDSWREEMHPLLRLDLTEPTEVEEAGLDLDGAATLNVFSGARISCMQVAHLETYQERVETQLRLQGDLVEFSERGVKLYGSKIQGKMFAGYALRKNETCAVYSENGQADVWLREAADLLLKKPSGPNVPIRGVMYLQNQYGVFALEGDEQKLKVTLHTRQVPLWQTKKLGPSPYAALTSDGLGVFRASVSPAGMQSFLQEVKSQIASICPPCDAQTVRLFFDKTRVAATGHVALFLDKVRVETSLRQAPARYFSVKHVVFIEGKSPAAIDEAVKTLARIDNARREDNGLLTVFTAGGNILVGRFGNHLFIANDDASLKLALAAMPTKTTPLSHTAEFEWNPKFVARGLRQVNVLDALGTPELASVFAAGVELGALMAQSEKVSGWLENTPSGAQQGFLQWTLEASKTESK